MKRDFLIAFVAGLICFSLGRYVWPKVPDNQRGITFTFSEEPLRLSRIDNHTGSPVTNVVAKTFWQTNRSGSIPVLMRFDVLPIATNQPE